MRPRAGRVAHRGVEATGDDQVSGIVAADAVQRFLQRFPVLLRRDRLRQRYVEIEAGTRTGPGLLAEAAEIGIGEAGMAMNRHGQDVGTRVENLLLPIAVMIVDVENRNPAVTAHVIGRDRGVAKIAEAAERAVLGMVAGGAGECVSEPMTLQ